MNILELAALKEKKHKITMVTCYDYWSAKVLNTSPIDIILVGDSGAMVMHGHTDTLPATIEMMSVHTQAVRRGAPDKFIVSDMPFLANRSDLASNIRAVQALMQAGANAVKIEGLAGNAEFVKHLTESGVPVMGHLGLTPQSIHALGGFKVQGREAAQAKLLLEHSRAFEDAGCFALVLECVPGTVAQEVSSALKIPVIGIGAGAGVDGQVLVLHDLLGLNQGFKPKFLRQYLNGAELIGGALEKYCADVRGGEFPNKDETYK